MQHCFSLPLWCSAPLASSGLAWIGLRLAYINEQSKKISLESTQRSSPSSRLIWRPTRRLVS
jgi:hypothetical protein